MELGAPLGVVSYHVRMLRDYDCVELVRTEPRRGALQHFYRATARPNLDEDQWRTLPSGLRRELTGETIQEIVTDLAAAATRARSRTRTSCSTRTPLELDERGFKKLNKLLAKTLEQALAIAAESAARRLSDGGLPDRARDPALQARSAENAKGPAAGGAPPQLAALAALAVRSCGLAALDLDDHLRAFFSFLLDRSFTSPCRCRPCVGRQPLGGPRRTGA